MRDSSRKRLVQRVRRIEALNEDSSYRVVSSEASDMDAVRVSTIHGSKGLEFEAVHIPALATRYLPVSRQGVDALPLPRSRTWRYAQRIMTRRRSVSSSSRFRARGTISASPAPNVTRRRTPALPNISRGSVDWPGASVSSGTGRSFGRSPSSCRSPRATNTPTVNSISICDARRATAMKPSMACTEEGQLRLHRLSSLRLRHHRMDGGRTAEREELTIRRARP